MRILATHHKRNHNAWLSRVTLLEEWQRDSEKYWRKPRPAAVRLCADLRWAWTFFRLRKDYDLFLTGTERPALLLALMQRALRPESRTPHVFMESMWNLPDRGVNRWKRRILLRLVAQAADRVIVYARHQREAYARLFGVPEEKFVFVHSHSTLYGVDYSPVEGGYIFSGGYTNRDYATLFAAVRDLPYPVVVCVGRRAALGVKVPANVEIREELPEPDFNRLMAGSAIVVLPLRGGVLEAGGRQVFQNAMAMGKAVIVTDLLASDYITDGVDGLLTPAGEVAPLRAAIVRLMSHPDEARALGANARRSSAAFVPERFFDSVFAVVEETSTSRAHQG